MMILLLYLILSVVCLVIIGAIALYDKIKHGVLLEKIDPKTNEVYYEYEKNKEKSDLKTNHFRFLIAKSKSSFPKESS